MLKKNQSAGIESKELRVMDAGILLLTSENVSQVCRETVCENLKLT